MKQHVKILLLLLATLLPSGAIAQLRWGATAGVSLNNLGFKQDIVSVSSMPGASAGIRGEIIFPGIGIGLDIGAQYQLRGAKVNLGQKEMWASQGYGNTTFMQHYLSLPIHLRWKYTRLGGLEEIFAPLIYVGPEFGFQFAHSKIDAFKFPGGEVGLDFGIGAELFRKWQITASYTMGLTYCTKADILTNYSARNKQWTLALTYFF